MNEVEKLKAILANLKSGVELSLFDFTNDRVILKENGEMFYCDVVFKNNKALILNVSKKETNEITIEDIRSMNV